ncbi:MAG: TIGR02757 family protein [Syntrophobacteraceae bacterium]
MKVPTTPTPPVFSKAALDAVYEQYNRREFVHPDPLEFLYLYDALLDREVVGMIASSLAYGRVAQILGSVAKVLAKMGPSPYSFLMESSAETLWEAFRIFKHRFTTGEQIVGLLLNIKKILEQYGSLEACFMTGVKPGDTSVLPALANLVEHLHGGVVTPGSMFVPSPCGGSACKRLNLFLRWMVRSDDVDPGGWHGVSPSMLIVPLDTHMHRVASSLGVTRRKQADMRTAIEITEGFKTIAPEDPIRYDFALTRPGIWDGMDI